MLFGVYGENGMVGVEQDQEWLGALAKSMLLVSPVDRLAIEVYMIFVVTQKVHSQQSFNSHTSAIVGNDRHIDAGPGVRAGGYPVEPRVPASDNPSSYHLGV